MQKPLVVVVETKPDLVVRRELAHARMKLELDECNAAMVALEVAIKAAETSESNAFAAALWGTLGSVGLLGVCYTIWDGKPSIVEMLMIISGVYLLARPVTYAMRTGPGPLRRELLRLGAQRAALAVEIKGLWPKC